MNQKTNVIAMPQREITPRPFAEVVKILDLKPALTARENSKSAVRRNQADAQDGHVILKSTRNNTLASLAGTMRHRGMTQRAIDAALQQENLARC